MNLLQRVIQGIYQLPTWTKVVGTTFFASFIPIIIILIVLGRGIAQLNESNLEAYLSDVAGEHQEQLDDAINDATDAISGISENVLFRNQILSMLSEPDNEVLRRTVENLLRNRLIESGQFEDVRILNLRGRLIVDMENTPLNTDVSQTDVGYRAGLNAQLLGDTLDRVVYLETEGEPNIDIVSLIYDNNDELVGYIIGTINEEELIFSALEGHDEFIPVYAYMVSRNGTLFAIDEIYERAQASSEISPIDLPYSGQSGVTNYIINDQRITAYYAPVADNEFSLIVETREAVVLVPPLGDIITNNIGALIMFTALGLGLSFFLIYLLNAPIQTLRESIHRMILGDFDADIPTAEREDMLGRLSKDLVELREQLNLTLQDQERRLEVRTRNMQATQEVSRYAATQRNPQILMEEVVNLIVQLFPNIYHAQIFLLDDDNNYAVLRASTGKPGRQLLARGHRLARGSVSVIGQVTSQGRTVIATDIGASDVHRKNEFLPDTMSELAIPLRLGNRIIGALDVQSRESNTFTEDQVTILETMADQISISLDSARLYQESVRRLEEIERTRQVALRHEWQNFLYDQRTNNLSAQAGQDTPVDVSLRERAIREMKSQIGQKTAHNTIPFAVPIQLRGTTLGAVYWELPVAEFNEDKVELAEELVNRLALTLENARLFEQSQRTAERERVVNEIASKLTGKTDIDEILQTAVREVGQALRAPEVNIRLNLNKAPATMNETSDAASNGHKE